MNTCHVMRDSSGLSLVELMIVLALSMILTGAVYLSSQSARETRNEQYHNMALQQDLRAVMDIMENDIHNAGCDPLQVSTPANPVFDIIESGPKTFSFTYDANMNGVLDLEAEKIAYRCPGSSLSRSSFAKGVSEDKETPVPLLSAVEIFQLTFYDANGAVTTSREGITSVEVTIRVSDASKRYHRELTRRIQLRNPRIPS
jgi:Tfp pilus assembly protein PilW